MSEARNSSSEEIKSPATYEFKNLDALHNDIRIALIADGSTPFIASLFVSICEEINNSTVSTDELLILFKNKVYEEIPSRGRETRRNTGHGNYELAKSGFIPFCKLICSEEVFLEEVTNKFETTIQEMELEYVPRSMFRDGVYVSYH